MNRPNFSGTWRFNHEKSLLEISSPDATILVIKHHEPYFRLDRTHTFGKTSDTFSIELTTDGEFVTKNHGGLEIRACMFWDDEVLVFDSALHRESQQGTNTVRYQLADKGQTFIAFEQVSFGEQNHKNTWVFDKQ
jgi:hypothetical protein